MKLCFKNILCRWAGLSWVTKTFIKHQLIFRSKTRKSLLFFFFLILFSERRKSGSEWQTFHGFIYWLKIVWLARGPYLQKSAFKTTNRNRNLCLVWLFVVARVYKQGRCDGSTVTVARQPAKSRTVFKLQLQSSIYPNSGRFFSSLLYAATGDSRRTRV